MKPLLAILVAALGMNGAGATRPAVVPAALIAGRAEVFVSDGAALQRALNEATAGQTILLEPARVYVGPFVVPARPVAAGRGDAWVTVRTRDVDVTRRTASGRRVHPSDAVRMARLVSSNGPVITAGPRAHHFRFADLHVSPTPGVFLHNVIDLGSGVTTLADVPHSFIFERMLIQGDPKVGSRRGIALNGGNTRVIDSYFSDFKERGSDSQALCGWNGPGPFEISNNYIEAAGENIMFGGADPTIEGLVPADIRITGNYITKPLAWRGAPWAVKNLLELKNARRVVIDGNLLEHNWPDGQAGMAVLFTPRNQDGGAPWSVVEDVSFTNNLVRHAGGGVHVLGTDDIHQSQPTQRVRIANNLFMDIGGEWGSGRLFLLVSGATDLTIENNTAMHSGPIVLADTAPHRRFVFRDNIAPHNEYGVIGSGTAPGWPSLRAYFPDATVEGNVLIGGDASRYPAGNFFPASTQEVGFTDPSNGNYRLAVSSAFRRQGAAGRDPGADIDAVATGLSPVAVPRVPVNRGAAVVFGVSASLLAYVYVGYPGLLWLAGRLRPKPVRAAAWAPSISIVVVAYNEAARIGKRIENLLSLDYPDARREIVVVSDGSTDGTAEVARLSDHRVRSVEYGVRRGKAAVFNAVIPGLNGDIVVLADARQRFDHGALRALLAGFADPTVGAVTGALVIGHAAAEPREGEGNGLYWRYETWIRTQESLVDSCVGMTGAIAAIRRRLFEPLPEDTILDDVLIPLRIVRRGYRVTFERRAIAYDGFAASLGDEFKRKVRTLAGNFQLFARERWLLDPIRNPLWVQTSSHKLLRLSIPVLLAAAVLSNLLLVSVPFFQHTLGWQGLFYGTALVGAVAPRLRRRVRGLAVPFTICFLSCATVVAFTRFVRHRQASTWERTAVGEAPAALPRCDEPHAADAGRRVGFAAARVRVVNKPQA